jgi:excisionase family DNA binding protein
MLSVLTLEDVCSLFKISQRTAYRWIKAGILKPTQVGHRFYFVESDIEALFNKPKGRKRG